MFPDYEPPEALHAALSQAAIVAADIFPESGSVEAALHSERYIPQRLLDQAAREISALYGLRKLTLTATHPESELQKIEPEELMQLFVSRNSMARGTLAGAKWEWNGCDLTIKLVANGKETLTEHIPVVQNLLRERFAAPVTIVVEAGESLEDKTVEELFQQDYKLFKTSGLQIGVGQGSFVSPKTLSQARELIRNYMPNALREQHIDMAFYLLTNVFDGCSELLYVGDGAEQLIEKAFGTECTGGSCLFPGMISRKKQFIPPLLKAMKEQE